MTPASDGSGITFLDHTADVGIDVTAPSLERLFHRAALGMLALLQGRDDNTASGDRDTRARAGGRGRDEPAAGRGALTVELEADDVVDLMAAWLRELLFLHETRHADYVRATFDRLGEGVLRARIETEPAAASVREIKGVTYHGLAVTETDDGWQGRVIFDV